LFILAIILKINKLQFGYYLIFFWLSILPFYKSEVRQKSKILTGKEFLNFERKIIQLLNDGTI